MDKKPPQLSHVFIGFNYISWILCVDRQTTSFSWVSNSDFNMKVEANMVYLNDILKCINTLIFLKRTYGCLYYKIHHFKSCFHKNIIVSKTFWIKLCLNVSAIVHVYYKNFKHSIASKLFQIHYYMYFRMKHYIALVSNEPLCSLNRIWIMTL